MDLVFFKVEVFIDLSCNVMRLQIHIQTMLEMASVRLRWKEKKGRLPTADDAERIYQKSLAATLDVLPNNSHVIKGLHFMLPRIIHNELLQVDHSG